MPEKVDLIWNADDWESTHDAADMELLGDDLRYGRVMRVGRAVQLPDAWMARNLDGELRMFPTEAEAIAFGMTDPATVST